MTGRGRGNARPFCFAPAFGRSKENTMSANVYAIGDNIVLKAGLTRTATGDRTCRVVGLLPAADRGENQYRVRFGSENFERRIVESDIDTSETASSAKKDEACADAPSGPWLKPSSIRIGK
jgi:hypothetical protein